MLAVSQNGFLEAARSIRNHVYRRILIEPPLRESSLLLKMVLVVV